MEKAQVAPLPKKKKFQLSDMLSKRMEAEKTSQFFPQFGVHIISPQKTPFTHTVTSHPLPSPAIVANGELTCTKEQIALLNEPMFELLRQKKKTLEEKGKSIALHEEIKGMVMGIVGNEGVTDEEGKKSKAREILMSIGFEETVILEVLKNRPPLNVSDEIKKFCFGQRFDPIGVPEKKKRRRGPNKNKTERVPRKTARAVEMVSGKEIVPEFPIQKFTNVIMANPNFSHPIPHCSCFTYPELVPGTVCAGSRLIRDGPDAKDPVPNLTEIRQYTLLSLNFGEYNVSNVDCSRLYSTVWVTYCMNQEPSEPRFTFDPEFNELLRTAFRWAEWEVKMENRTLSILNKWPSLRQHPDFQLFVRSHNATFFKLLPRSEQDKNAERIATIKNLNYLAFLYKHMKFSQEEMFSFILYNVHSFCSMFPVSGFRCILQVLAEQLATLRIC